MSGAPDLLATLTPVVATLDRLGVVYQVGGSVASSIHGMARSTMDIDIVADLDPDHVDRLVAALEPEYYVDAQMIREALRDRSSFSLIHQGTMLKVDVLVPKDRPYDREALRRRTVDRLEEGSASGEFCVATAEDVVLAKLDWFDRGGRVSERPWGDILGVLRVQGESLEFDYLTKWAEELGVEDLIRQALRER